MAAERWSYPSEVASNVQPDAGYKPYLDQLMSCADSKVVMGHGGFLTGEGVLARSTKPLDKQV